MTQRMVATGLAGQEKDGGIDSIEPCAGDLTPTEII